eukprot:m.329809 g.329809  ORF g.329809 m.329809 type:complete len:77 (-) comp19758_c0_seq3:385-615(-)
MAQHHGVASTRMIVDFAPIHRSRESSAPLVVSSLVLYNDRNLMCCHHMFQVNFFVPRLNAIELSMSRSDLSSMSSR